VSENPNVLIAEATEVVTDSKRYLEAAEELVVGIPTRRRALMERIVAAEERSRQAKEKYRRVWHEEVGKWEERELEEEWLRASGHVDYLRDQLAADDLQPENRKAVARQLAGHEHDATTESPARTFDTSEKGKFRELRQCELPRIPKRRRSQNSPSKHSGE
jgi:hypothetical protein